MAKQLFYAPVKKLMDGDNKYSRTIKIPQYEPSNVRPNLWELYDKSKYTELAKNIARSGVPEDVKDFLMFAATRHIVFNYGARGVNLVYRLLFTVYGLRRFYVRVRGV